MTTTTITATHRSRSLSALLHDALHVRALSRSEALDVEKTAVSQRRKQANIDQTTMLVTFAGRYGAHF